MERTVRLQRQLPVISADTESSLRTRILFDDEMKGRAARPARAVAPRSGQLRPTVRPTACSFFRGLLGEL